VASRNLKRWFIGFGVYVVVCFILGLLPHHGPPHFRYPGADPHVDVWNLGWPLATMIWDSRSGLHVWPFTYALFPALFILGLASLTVALLIRWVRATTGRR